MAAAFVFFSCRPVTRPPVSGSAVLPAPAALAALPASAPGTTGAAPRPAIAATLPTVSTSNAPSAPVDTRPPTRVRPDPTAGYPTLATHEEPLKGTNGTVRRVRIVKADFKYPLWRVEETLACKTGSREPAVVSRGIVVADHVLVQLKRDAAPDAINDLARRHGLTIRKASSTPGLYLLASPDAKPDTVPNLVKALSSEPLVRFAEPDSIVSAFATFPNDTSFGQLWGLHNTGQSGGTVDADIDAPEAWDLGTGSTDIVAAVIDSGVNHTHPDLAANIWSNPLEVANGIDDDGNGFTDDVRGWDFYSGDANPADENGHGSHCAGTIAAAGNNARGVVGVNWRCRILPLRFLGPTGSGTSSDAIDALNYAVLLRQRGVNLRLTSNSWGGGGAEQAMEAAIIASQTAGLLFVAAAGNEGMDNDVTPFYPASYPESNVIAVAATDRNDALAGFSHYGLTSVDLAAPGVSIYSTSLGTGYEWLSGTSMAAPHVSGVAALLASLSPSADWATIRRAILAGADPRPSLTGRTATGGRLNALGAIQAITRIVHTPLSNTYVTNASYAVDALISPVAIINTNACKLFWNTDGSTNPAGVAPFSVLLGESWRASIPEQPEGTTIRYWISATTVFGATILSPTNAPDSVYHFSVVPPQSLAVSGTPVQVGAVSPEYGNHTYPSGDVVRAQAELHTQPDGTTRWRCAGWTGTGSAPGSGTTTAVTFAVQRPSTIVWNWTRQFALTQTSDVCGLVNTTTWWDASASASTITAPAALCQASTNYAFAFWRLDGVRQPHGPRPAVNPVVGIYMATSHVATAVYLPQDQDADSDGMPDWWELFFFGSTNTLPAADNDGDGISNRDEYRDRSDPTVATSRPAAPVISHVPLADPQGAPAPFQVDAVITDNYMVAAATLSWSRSGVPMQQTNMVAVGATGLYRAFIPAPGTNGDAFVYTITASDPSGRTATNGPHQFRVDYPIMVVTPVSITNVSLRSDSSENRFLTVSNLGSGLLSASMRFSAGGIADHFDTGADGWLHSGINDLWTVASRRWASPSNAWYCGDAEAGVYASAMHARLDSPALFVPPKAVLTFKHWLQCERDVRSGRSAYCWDGAIVEVSTNGGADFASLAPIGGYPFRISGWDGDPGEAWPEGTPCFAGTGTWQTAAFDLSAFAARWIVIRWHFGSDGNTQEEGWYIDDVSVSSPGSTNDWLSWNPTNLSVASSSCATVIVTASSARVATGDRGALLHIDSNDPFAPVRELPVCMSVRSPPATVILNAAQTSTRGEGLVTITNAVIDQDGDVCALEWLWSTNGGAMWRTNWIIAATASYGSVQYMPGGTTQVTKVGTTNATGVITNLVTVTWDSTTPAGHVVLSTDTLIRARAWDGTAWSAPCTSQPFLVDNQAPSTPTSFNCLSHVPDVWSTNRVLRLTWAPASDGAGIGIAGYRYGVLADISSLVLTSQTLTATACSTPLGDGTNWQAAVQAVDAFGNTSAAALLGRFRIDSTPPSATGVVLTLSRSTSGPYAIGPGVAGTWTGFTDAGSGIAGYYAALTNRQGTTNGTWTTVPSVLLQSATLDATQTVYVWACDTAGLMSPAASASILVLSDGGDWDRDGLLNGQEELAGTDARNPSSTLCLSALASNEPSGPVFVIRWQGVTNRSYSLSYSSNMATTNGPWTAFGDGMAILGVTGYMSYTDRTVAVPIRFYRVSVQP